MPLLVFFDDPSVVWILIPLAGIAIPIVGKIVALFRDRQQVQERNEARKMYERLAMEKLDVLKSALAMGYKSADLADLDNRLERLLGSDKMSTLLSATPLAPSTRDLAAADVAAAAAAQSAVATDQARA